MLTNIHIRKTRNGKVEASALVDASGDRSYSREIHSGPCKNDRIAQRQLEARAAAIIGSLG